MLPKLHDLLDEIDAIASSGTDIEAAQRLAAVLAQARHPVVRREVEAYVRAYGFVVRRDEYPPVQLPGIYDPAVIDELELHLSECSEFERERAHSVYIASLYP